MPAVGVARALYLQNLLNLGYGPGTPARDIVTMAGRELWNSAMTTAALMSALTHNFYHYGRVNGWVWGSGSNGNGNALAIGEPLLRGTIQGTNCGGFNGSLRLLAHTILGVPGVTNADATTPDAFLTHPNLSVIDQGWTGNVRTLGQDFATMRCFFFVGHSWNRLGGDHYDASTNVVAFNGLSDLAWCRLTKPPQCTAGAWSCNVTGPPQPHGPAPYLVVRTALLKQYAHLFPIVATAPTFPGGVGVTQGFINALPDQIHNWTTLLLVSRSHLPQAFRTIIHYP